MVDSQGYGDQMLRVRRALAADIPQIVRMVNAAYRGETSRQGWTTEADLLGGQRTDVEEITELMAAPRSLILLCQQGEQLVGTAHLRGEGAVAHLGMLTVRPGMQGAGIGKWLMAEAERFVQDEWRSTAILMGVISLRHELIAFYRRRGFLPTGERQPFPDSERFGIPKVDVLEFEILRKELVAHSQARSQE